jgi:thioredoxin-like negative regulator of GroEL
LRFFSFTLLSGCHRDPNVRKQKYLESGQRYSAQGKDKEAAIQFANALKIDKNFADAHYALAKTYLHMGALSALSANFSAPWACSRQTTRRGSILGICTSPEASDDAQAQAAASCRHSRTTPTLTPCFPALRPSGAKVTLL